MLKSLLANAHMHRDVIASHTVILAHKTKTKKALDIEHMQQIVISFPSQLIIIFDVSFALSTSRH